MRVSLTRSIEAAARPFFFSLGAATIELVARQVGVPPKFEVIDTDNGCRGDSKMEKLQSLKPAFIKPHGTVTAGTVDPKQMENSATLTVAGVTPAVRLVAPRTSGVH